MLHTPGLCNELYLHESHIGCNTLLARRLFLKQNNKFQGEKKMKFLHKRYGKNNKIPQLLRWRISAL